MNVFSITGNLGRDCEVKQVGSSTVCNFSVAVKSGYGDREQTLWVDCALWGKAAEGRLPEYLKKGQQVATSGELSTYESDAGKTYLKLRCNSVDLCGGKSDNVTPSQPAQEPAQQPAPQKQAEAFNDFDDDIPF